MAVRFSIANGRLVISKAGFNANDPSLADGNKLFDSLWNFSGLIVAKSIIQGPVTLPHTVTFDDIGYVPAGLAIAHFKITNTNDVYYGGADTTSRLIYSEIHSNQLVIGGAGGSGTVDAYVEYVVYAVGPN